MSDHGSHYPSTSPSVTLPDDFLLTFPQASRRVGISESTLRRAVKDGKLIAHVVGKYLRIRNRDLSAYIASLRRPS